MVYYINKSRFFLIICPISDSTESFRNHSITCNVNSEATVINLITNKLGLNIVKIGFMFFGSRQRLATFESCDLSIHIDGHQVKQV